MANFTSIGPKFSLKDTKGKTKQLKDKLFFMKNSSKRKGKSLRIGNITNKVNQNNNLVANFTITVNKY